MIYESLVIEGLKHHTEEFGFHLKKTEGKCVCCLLFVASSDTGVAVDEMICRRCVGPEKVA